MVFTSPMVAPSLPTILHYPLSSPVFGWLLCVSSSIGGRLMPSNFWCLFQSSPDTMRKHPQYALSLRPFSSTSLPLRPPIHSWLLLVVAKWQPPKAKAPSISSRCPFITSEPAVAPPSPAAAASLPGCCCCCCSQYRAHHIARACSVSLFGDLCGTERSFSSTVRSGKVGVRH